MGPDLIDLFNKDGNIRNDLSNEEEKLFPEKSVSLKEFVSKALSSIPNEEIQLRNFLIKKLLSKIDYKNEEIDKNFNVYKNNENHKIFSKILSSLETENWILENKIISNNSLLSLIINILLRIESNWNHKDLLFISKYILKPSKENNLSILTNILLNYSFKGSEVKVDKINKNKKLFEDVKFFIKWKENNSGIPLEVDYLLKENAIENDKQF